MGNLAGESYVTCCSCVHNVPLVHITPFISVSLALPPMSASSSITCHGPTLSHNSSCLFYPGRLLIISVILHYLVSSLFPDHSFSLSLPLMSPSHSSYQSYLSLSTLPPYSFITYHVSLIFTLSLTSPTFCRVSCPSHLNIFPHDSLPPSSCIQWECAVISYIIKSSTYMLL